MTKIIPYYKPSITKVEIDNSIETLKSGWISTGNKAKEFEEKFSNIVKSKYTFAVNSCTSALHLAIECLDIKSEDRVFVPSMTFVSSVEILRYKNAHPVFLDIDYETLLITPKILKAAISKNPDVRFLILVHFAGQAAEMGSIRKICSEYNVKIIEDCAHAFPSLDGDKYIGSDSEVACFSFYANKTITTGEGGMITTNNSEIAKKISRLRIHGFDRDVWSRYNSDKPNWEYDVVEAGYKYNLPDMNAVLGITQLDRAKEERNKRQIIAEYYYNFLNQIEEIDLVFQRQSNKSNSWHLFPIVLNNKSKVSRNDLIQILSDNGIGTSVHYKPVHLMSYYKKNYFIENNYLENTMRYWEGCLSLPIYPLLQISDIEFICNKIKSALAK